MRAVFRDFPWVQAASNLMEPVGEQEAGSEFYASDGIFFF